MTNAEKVYENVLTRTGEQKPRSIAEQMRDLLLRASPRNRRAWEEGSRSSILDRMGVPQTRCLRVNTAIRMKARGASNNFALGTRHRELLRFVRLGVI
jgi:hypothetical protein